MKIITFEDIRKLGITPATCFEWVSEMIKRKNDVILPAKISMVPEEKVFCNVMPCILNQLWGGVKVITRYPKRNPCMDSRLILMDMETGEYLALMDADWITAMRTGAVAAHSIMLLANQGFSEIGIIGLGNSARASLLILAEKLPERELHVRLLCHKGQEKIFAERFSGYKNLYFTYEENAGELVAKSEVVISAATYLEQDVCDNKYFKEGVLVVPIHTRGFQNCDLFFDKIYADDYMHICHFKYFGQFRSFAEISDVINGRAEGRKNARERILVYNIGLSMHDISFGAKIYQMLEGNQMLADIDMREPHEKFWV